MDDIYSGSTLAQRATEFVLPVEKVDLPLPLPPTSPYHGFSHPISQNIMFTAPPMSRFVLAPNASLSVTIFHARFLDTDGNTKYNPFVRAVQGDYKYMSTTATTDQPVWNETFKFPILNPVKELLILELWDDKAFGKSLLGYVPIDLSLLPRGVEVDTWEKLSYSTNGEISIGLTANGFGLETLPRDYDQHYEEWRKTLLAVSKYTNISKKGTITLDEAPGPYTGKSVPAGYIVDNGHVKKLPSAMTKALGKAKAVFGLGSAAR